MSRSTLERRRLGEERWPELCQLLGSYFGQHVFHQYETLAGARRAAVAGHDLDGQKRIVREWIDWNRQIGASENIRAALDAYGVELDFDDEAGARLFMNELYDELIVAIRKQEKGWRP